MYYAMIVFVKSVKAYKNKIKKLVTRTWNHRFVVVLKIIRFTFDIVSF